MNYNDNISLAPIVIFAYNRPDKLKQLLDSLEKNLEFKKSDLIFYIDNIKNDDDKINNEKVIEIANNNHSTKSTIINVNKENFGLKQNIINGINKTFEIYKSAIFLEDDLVVSKHFLDYMNTALKLYDNNPNVLHISGYNFPNFRVNSNSSYFTKVMNCWGWATWKTKWEKNQNFTKNNISNLNNKNRRKFNILGFEKDFESQLIRNENNELETWAIFWYQHIFLENAYCLHPKSSLVQNTGMDGSGERDIHSTFYDGVLNRKKIKTFPKKTKYTLLNRFQTTYFYLRKKIRKDFNL